MFLIFILLRIKYSLSQTKTDTHQQHDSLGVIQKLLHTEGEGVWVSVIFCNKGRGSRRHYVTLIQCVNPSSIGQLFYLFCKNVYVFTKMAAKTNGTNVPKAI